MSLNKRKFILNKKSIDNYKNCETLLKGIFYLYKQVNNKSQKENSIVTITIFCKSGKQYKRYVNTQVKNQNQIERYSILGKSLELVYKLEIKNITKIKVKTTFSNCNNCINKHH